MLERIWAHVFHCGYVVADDLDAPQAWPAQGARAWFCRRIEPVLYGLLELTR